MPFPATDRVIYERNPLQEVITQLRFPPILRIETQPPAAFQERLRAQYPVLRESAETDLPTGVPLELATLIRSQFPKGRLSFQFATEDGLWTVSLTREFVALTTKKYERWEDFRHHLEPVLQALQDEYHPAHFSRIGLRYRDVVQRSTLGLSNAAWSDLLQPHVAGELADKDVASAIRDLQRQLVVELGGGGLVTIRHGLTTFAEEECYVVDADFHTTDKTETKNALATLDGFNRKSGRLFRWCIKDKLHSAMGPRMVR